MPKIADLTWKQMPGGPKRISGQDDGPYAEVILGDQVNLTQFGVRLERLPPGSRSSHRHWHETEDEFVFIVSGQLTLVEDTEVTLHPGDAAGWPAGLPVAHCLENRSTADAVFLVVGARSKSGVVHYPDHNLIMHHDESGHRFTDSAGTRILVS